MSSLSVRAGTKYPLIHVQDVKDGVLTGGGFKDETVRTAPDLTYVVYNSIPGASLYVNGSSSSTSKTFPTIAATTSIINNPDASTHNHNCYVILPAGEYEAEYSLGSDAAGYEVVGLYDLTADEWLSYPIAKAGSGNVSTGDVKCRFSITVESHIELATPPHYNTPSIIDLGYIVPVSTADGSLAANSELRIYKIG
jgi:hypothetical protein